MQLQRNAISTVVFFSAVFLLTLIFSAIAYSISDNVEQSEVFVIAVFSFFVVGIVFLAAGARKKKADTKSAPNGPVNDSSEDQLGGERRQEIDSSGE